MDESCPNCGYQNEPLDVKCRKCGTDLLYLLNEQQSAMQNIKLFSLIFFFSAIAGSIEFVFRYTTLGQFGIGIFSTFPNPSQIENGFARYLFIIEAMSGISTVLTLASVVFIRKGFKTLAKRDSEFNTPVTGTTLFFAGLAVMLVGVLVIFGMVISLLSQIASNPSNISLSTLVAIAGVGFVVLIGALLVLGGVIMGVIIGLHNLSVKYDERLFDIAWILYVVSFFLFPVGLIAAYLSYSASAKTLKRIEDAAGGSDSTISTQ